MARAQAAITRELARAAERAKVRLQKRPAPVQPDLLPRQTGAELDKLLWSGHAPYAIKELTAITQAGSWCDEVPAAAWALTRRYAFVGDYQRALECLDLTKLGPDGQYWDCGRWVVEIAILVELGHAQEAENALGETLRKFGELPELCLMAANVANLGAAPDDDHLAVDRKRLAWINKPFAAAGLALLTSADPRRRLAFDNLTTSSVPAHPDAGMAKLSVIMPAYNAAETLPVALKSVLAQSWNNLEVLIVDDASTDNTWSVIQSFAANDSRIIALRHDNNRGCHSARNTGLRHATGELVTVHDADDWSHPQKFALQAIHLLTTDESLNTTLSARIHPDLTVGVKFSNASALFENIGSLMLKRHTAAAMGGWDEARVVADAEFYDRLVIQNINRNVLCGGVPLTLYLFRPEALTASSAAGIATVKYGSWRQYKEAYQYWHKIEKDKDKPQLVMSQQSRPFPAPAICLTQRPETLHYDVLHVSDFSRPGTSAEFEAGMMEAGHGLRLKQAWFHLPGVDAPGRRIDERMRKRFHNKFADCVVAGETVDCDVVLLYHPPILAHIPDPLPKITAKSCVLIAHEASLTTPQRMWHDLGYDIDQAVDATRSVFGVEPTVAPVSPIVRNAIRLATTYPRLTKRDWTPVLDESVWKRKPISWSSDRLPVVGGYSGLCPENWSTLRDAFGAERACEVRVLGDSKMAKIAASYKPSNWSFWPIPEVDVHEFLAALDICVCYPHRDTFGMLDFVPIEAMATGIPVILSPGLRNVYGDAAVYANPTDVFDVVEELWHSKAGYERQVERGSRYVQHNCSFRALAERLKPYLRRSTKFRLAWVDFWRL